MKTLRYKTEVLSCVAHFLVDLTCTACLGRLSSRLSYDSIIACAILYNALAFAFQLPIGALADFWGITRILAAAGCLLVALGALFPQPLPLCLLIGLGNACFHVGAGREALQLGGAAPVGRFVAPGALGIFFGPRLAGFPLLRLLLPMLLVLSGLSLLPRQKERTAAAGPRRFPLPAALCMFLTVRFCGIRCSPASAGRWVFPCVSSAASSWGAFWLTASAFSAAASAPKPPPRCC